MKNVIFLFLILLPLSWSCQKEEALQTDAAAHEQEAARYEKQALDLIAEDQQTTLEFRGRTISVPAGYGLLQGAVEEAPYGATLLLEEGLHSLSGTLVIQKSLRLMGTGAETTLEVDTDANTEVPLQVDPAILVVSSGPVEISNITIQDPDGIGQVGILLLNSDKSRISGNRLLNFRYTLLVEGSDQASVHDNLIQSSPEFSVWGMVNVNGKNTRVYNNRFVNTTNGLFVGDAKGVAVGNEFEHTDVGGGLGLLLCTPNILGEFMVLPDGTPAQAETSATGWIAVNNTASNWTWGFLAIDGANNNILINNRAEKSALYDIELAGPSERFGFFTPTSSNNTVFRGRDQLIKVCGENNRAFGGNQVDTGLDPCN